MYEIEADAACFSSILHLCRFGYLVPLPVDQKYVLDQAEFWGVRDEVSKELSKELSKKKREVTKLKELLMELNKAKVHHNFRRDDGYGRIYCSDCGSRDFDSYLHDSKTFCIECNGQKFGPPSKYTDCKGCGKAVMYSKELGWCHKCSMCKRCQKSVCPNDKYISCRHSYYSQQKRKTTKELEEELYLREDST